MTPVFCCGGECGVAGPHWTLDAAAGSFSTSTVRSGGRSIRLNPAAINAINTSIALTSSNILVGRFYIRFTTLPNVDCFLFGITSTNQYGLLFKQSDSKIYPGRAVTTTLSFGASGFTVTTGIWYRVDIKVDISNNPRLVDVSVDGTALTQFSVGVAAGTYTAIILATSNSVAGVTADVFYDDIVVSQTLADYPFGPGKVEHYVPTSDGSHNVAGANDFERSATGTDITNATTTAFQLIDDVPLKSGVVTEYINLIAPPNSTDYVEVVFGPAPGISTPTTAPRAVEAIVAYASATAGTTNNLRIALNDNGSLDDVLNVTAASPGTTAVYARKHYSDPPSAASEWTLTGNGNFNNVRMRCFTSDAAPDPWWASAMIEAEFQEIVVIPNKIFQVKQAVNRAGTY